MRKREGRTTEKKKRRDETEEWKTGREENDGKQMKES